MTELKIDCPSKFYPATNTDKRWVIIKGGRDSGKSWSIASLMVCKTIFDGKTRLCTRPVQKSIRDSSHKLIVGAIKRLKVEHLFDIKRDYIVFIKTGAEFIFTGMKDVKSMEGVQDVWIEEAQDATEQDLLDLSPTLRQDGSQIYASYNPKNIDDPIHERATGELYDSLRHVVHMNWDDNPWYSKVLEPERLAMKSINIDLYNHIWGGEILKTIEGALIKAAWFGRYTKLPTLTSAYIIADTASEAKEEHDYNVYLFCAKGIDGKIYLIDQWRGKAEAPERISKARDFWNKHRKRMGYGIGATDFKVEKASSGFDLIQHLSKDISISGITRKATGNPFIKKFGRLMDVIIPISEGLCLLPEGDIYYNDILVTDGAWVDDAVTEYQQFTADDSHDYDDQVDVLIDAVAILGSNAKSNLAKSLYSRR